MKEVKDLKLIDKNVKLNDIMLDPLNPRFVNCISYKQDDILNILLGKKANRELSNSMNQGIRWINKIVVRDINSLQNNKKNKIPDINNYKYIVIEGNNRLACLKSGKICSQAQMITFESKIPILIATREENENIEHYEMEIKIIQGISNVMVVKEWDTVPKAKHIFTIYETKQNMNPNMKMAQITSEIGYELGLDNSKVKDNIIRYSLFKEINELSDTISEDDWGFLEAFDQTPTTRSLFGMCKNSVEFEWNKNEDDYNQEKQDLLILAPEIIKNAKKEYPNCKKFRDDFKKLVNNKYNDFDEVKNTINNIINPDESASWSSISENLENYTNEQKSRNCLADIYNKLDTVCLGADWSINLEPQIIEIKKKIEKFLKILNPDNNEY